MYFATMRFFSNCGMFQEELDTFNVELESYQSGKLVVEVELDGNKFHSYEELIIKRESLNNLMEDVEFFRDLGTMFETNVSIGPMNLVDDSEE